MKGKLLLFTSCAIWVATPTCAADPTQIDTAITEAKRTDSKFFSKEIEEELRIVATEAVSDFAAEIMRYGEDATSARREAYEKASRTVKHAVAAMLNSGRTSITRADFIAASRILSRVTIKSTPAGATLVVDDVKMTDPTDVKTWLSAGEGHSIVASLGGASKTEIVTPTKGKTSVVEFDF